MSDKMVIGEIDIETIGQVVRALAGGLHKAEAETSDGRKVTGYWMSDDQIRIDLVKNKD